MTDQASQMRHNEQAIDSTHHAHHIVPARVYWTVIIILMVLTWFTYWISTKDLSHYWSLGNLAMALGVATLKATIVALWFMHVKYSGKLVQLTIVTSLMFLMLMLFGVLMDVWTRHNVNAAGYPIIPEYEKTAQVELPHGHDDNKPH